MYEFASNEFEGKVQFWEKCGIWQ